MAGTRVRIIGSIAVVAGLISLFFVFYTVRLLVVTHGLTAIRTGGKGAYAGAVAFPLLAIAFGWESWKLLQRMRRSQKEDSGTSGNGIR